jgi:multiple sugar transport system substrate-binding protein
MSHRGNALGFRRRSDRGLLLLAMVALIAAACTGGGGGEEGAKPQGATGQFGSISREEMLDARKSIPVNKDVPDFGSVQITVMGDAGHNMNPFGMWSPELKSAGLTINVVEVPFEEVYSRETAEFVGGTGAVDLVVFYPAFIGDFAGNNFIRPLDEYTDKYDPAVDDVITAFRELYLKWDGKLYALPYDGDVHMLLYRKDLLNNPTEQKAFQQQYGRKLQVPQTWDEYLEIGEFFTREPGEMLADKKLTRPFYGCAEYGARGFSWAWFMNRFAGAGGVYFDEQMNPQINTPEAVEALENMKEAVEVCSPPDVLNFGYDQLRDIFIKNQAFMVVQWTDVPKKAADPAESQVVGKVGYASVPGVELPDGTINHRAMMPVGRVLAVAADSDNPEEAYWVAYYLSRQTSLYDVSTPLTGLDPYRRSHINPDEYEMFGQTADAQKYLKAVEDALEIGFPEIYIPGAAKYNDALDRAVNAVISGESGAQGALDDAASEWNEITDDLERDRQVELWNSALETYRQLGLLKE